MKSKVTIFVLCLCFFCIAAFDASRWQYYTSQTTINAFAETDSSWWVGTNGGLVEIRKKSGSKNYLGRLNSQIRGNIVSALYKDRNGTLWVAAQSSFSSGGIAYQAVTALRKDNTVKTFSPVCIDGWIDKFSFISEDSKGQIWLSVKKKLYKIENDSVVYDSDFGANIECMVHDDSWRLWVVGEGKLAYLQNGIWNRVKDFPDPNFWIDKTPSNEIWVSTLQGVYKVDDTTSIRNNTTRRLWGVLGIIVTDGNGVIWSAGSPYKTHEPLRGFHGQDTIAGGISAKKLFRDSQNRIWAVTEGDSLLRRENNQWTYVPIDKGDLPSEDVYSLCTDHLGRVWAGTGKGMACFDNNKWVNFTPHDTLPNHKVNLLYEDRNNRMWAGMTYRLLKLNNAGTSWVDENMARFGSYKTVSRLIHTRSNKLWLQNYYSTFRRDYQGGEWDSVDKQGAMSLCEDSQDRIWLGGRGYYQNDTFHSVPSNNIQLVYEHDDGTMWGASIYYKNLLTFKGTVWQETNCKVSSVRAFTRHSAEAFWISDGYSVFTKLISKDGSTLDSVTSSNSPMNSSIYCMTRDSSGHVWIGSIDGLFRYDPGTITVKVTGEKVKPVQHNSIALQNNRVVISLDIPGVVTVALSDLRGRSIGHATKNYSGHGPEIFSLAELEAKKLPAGTYLLSVSGKGFTLYKKIVTPGARLR